MNKSKKVFSTAFFVHSETTSLVAALGLCRKVENYEPDPGRLVYINYDYRSITWIRMRFGDKQTASMNKENLLKYKTK